MKKPILIFMSAILSQIVLGQVANGPKNLSDPFCQMIRTIYSLDAICFNSQVNKKQVFENDTITSYAKIIVKKKGKPISFLQIIPESGIKELLFFNDSAWITDHNNKTITFLGIGIDQLTHNYLSEFFPFSIYNVDTAICLVQPFWKIISSTKEYTVISVDITNAAKELSGIRVEYSIGNADFLPQKTLQEVLYMEADKLFQEVDFSGYSFPDPEQVKIPGYFFTYAKDFSLVQDTLSSEVKKADVKANEVYIKDPELYDLSGKPFNLPQDGLIFLDLWYVGCPPCMKSAPVIEKLYNEFKDRVYFFSVNETDRDTAKIERFKEKMGITFPVLLGGEEKLAGKINGGNGYPVFILMDAETGKVLWNKQGYAENLQDLITEAIKLNL